MKGVAMLRVCSWFCALSTGASFVRGPGVVFGKSFSGDRLHARPCRLGFQFRCMNGGGGSDVRPLRECRTKFGAMKYRFLPSSCEGCEPKGSKASVIFLHGLTSSSLTCQPPESLLSQYTFLVPDFFGHGASPSPLQPEAYSMGSLATAVANILEEEALTDVFVIAHSMGGPIGIELCEQIMSNSGMRLRGLVYEEGNLDEGDCFGSNKMVKKGAPEVGPSSPAEDLRRFGQCECAKDLVRVSVSGELLPRILKVKQSGVPVWFAYGEKNRGRFSSEQLLEHNGEQITFIAGGAHSMHADEGAEAFWDFVARLLRDVEDS